MATLIYIHGFLSSPLSHKAQQVKDWLAQYRPDIDYLCPQLPPYPNECAQILEDTIMSVAKQPVALMGSSMGGFWATWLANRFACKAVLINPAVDVLSLMPHYLNQRLCNYHHQTYYELNTDHLTELQHYRVEQPLALTNYWVLLQEGDEILDYRLAVAKYQGCRQTVEPGGDHSFQYFERHIQASIQFLFKG